MGREITTQRFLSGVPFKKISKSKAVECYRFFDTFMILQVQKSGKRYRGFFVHYITLMDTSDEQKSKRKNSLKDRILLKKVNLNNDSAKVVFSFFQRLDSLPDMSEISGWKQKNYQSGRENYEPFIIESNLSGIYKLRNFCNFSEQDTSPSSFKKIGVLMYQLYTLQNLYTYYREFMNSLPPGRYTNGAVQFRVHSQKKE